MTLAGSRVRYTRDARAEGVPRRGKRQRTTIGLAALGIFLIAACSRSPGQSYGELDTGFKVALKVRTAQPAGLEASILSTTTYPCAGYTIRGSSWRSRDTIVLAIHGMGRPSPCVPLASEATGTLYLGDVPDGPKILRITYRGEADLHRVSVLHGRVTTSPIRSRFTRVSGR